MGAGREKSRVLQDALDGKCYSFPQNPLFCIGSHWYLFFGGSLEVVVMEVNQLCTCGGK